MFGGVRIVTSTQPPFIKQVGEDWSRVRSPGRAARRRRRGYRQNIEPIYEPTGEVYRFGDRLIMHPATADALKRAMVDRGSDGSYTGTPVSVGIRRIGAGIINMDVP